MGKGLRLLAGLAGVLLWFGLIWLTSYIEQRDFRAICPQGYPAGGSRCFRDMIPASVAVGVFVVMLSPLLVLVALSIFGGVARWTAAWRTRYVLASMGAGLCAYATWFTVNWETTLYGLVFISWFVGGLVVTRLDRERSKHRAPAAVFS